MKSIDTHNGNYGFNRRKFIGDSAKMAVLGSIAGMGLLGGCKEKEAEKEVSPPEDLMQEHGVLKRVLLIYDACRLHLMHHEPFPIEAIQNGAHIIRTFIEDYHEQQEERYLFPRFKKAHQLTGLVEVLLQQHQAGRALTDELLQLSGRTNRTDSENDRLIYLLLSFNTMYNPHEAREDTILFPAFRKIVSANEYDSLGEEFEKNEHRLFGADGFEAIVQKVANIEQSLGIYDLSQFTPKV